MLKIDVLILIILKYVLINLYELYNFLCGMYDVQHKMIKNLKLSFVTVLFYNHLKKIKKIFF
jgi:hypothetical protein